MPDVVRNYRCRASPRDHQREAIDDVLKLHRELYNAALQERRDAYRKAGVSVTYGMQANQLKEIRVVREDLATPNSSSLQQTLRRLDKAFAAFFRRVQAGQCPGFPRFKGRHRFRSVSFVYGDGSKVRTDDRGRQVVYLQGIAKHLAEARRVVSRRRRGSERYGKARKAVARIHAKIAGQRRDFYHQASARLVGQWGFIAVEELNIRGLARGMLATSVHDAGYRDTAAARIVLARAQAAWTGPPAMAAAHAAA